MLMNTFIGYTLHEYNISEYRMDSIYARKALFVIHFPVVS